MASGHNTTGMHTAIAVRGVRARSSRPGRKPPDRTLPSATRRCKNRSYSEAVSQIPPGRPDPGGWVAMSVVTARLRTVALLMLLLLAACTSSPNAHGESNTYSLCTGAVLPTGAVPDPPPAGGVDDVIRQADQLVADSHLDDAAELYRYRLEKDPTDACAARGLSYLAALAAVRPPTGVGAAAGRWDDLYQSRIVPGFTILVPFAVVLAVLFGLAHVLTGRVVRPGTVVHHAIGDRALRWVGLAALLVAAWLATAHFYTAGGNSVTRWWNAACAAGVGLLFTAFGQGSPLKVQIEGRKADGTTTAFGQHVMARLQELGSERPRGIEVTQQTDVTTLPGHAVSALPQGAVAKALLGVAQALLLRVPWQVTVTRSADATVAASIIRNGRPVDSMVMSYQQSDTATRDGEGADPVEAHLATAAAAFTLATLRRRHPVLAKGLAGATRWRSIYLQVTATSPGVPPEEQRTRLAKAVEADPRNAAAQAALLHVHGRHANDGPSSKLYATGLDNLLSRIPSYDEPVTDQAASRPDDAYAALFIRLLFNSAVAWQNHYLFSQDEGKPDPASRDKALARAKLLEAELLRDRRDRGLQEFVNDVKPAADYLCAAIRASCSNSPPVGASNEPVRASGVLVRAFKELVWAALTVLVRAALTVLVPASKEPARTGGLLSLTAVYTRACWHAAAAERSDVERLGLALDDLALAATRTDLREWARTDPSFLIFRRGGNEAVTPKLRTRYYGIVGVRPPSRRRWRG